MIHLDTGWFKTDWLCEWKFNEERFPDPEGFIRGLKDKGFRVTLWQLPYVAEDAEQIDEARKNHYICTLTKQQEGEGSNFSALDYAGIISRRYGAGSASANRQDAAGRSREGQIPPSYRIPRTFQ